MKTIATFQNLRQRAWRRTTSPTRPPRTSRALKASTYVNLTNTKVTNQGFAAVAALPKLQRLYVWGAGVTPTAAKAVRAERKN